MAAIRMKDESEGFLKVSEGQAAMLRCGETNDITMATVFLSSDKSRFLTGDDFKVEGACALCLALIDLIVCISKHCISP